MISYSIILSILLLPTISFSQTSDQLFNYQWAIKNSGQSYLIKEDKLEFNTQHSLNNTDINWIAPQNIAPKQKQVIVAVIDRGIDYNHPDLKGRIWIDKNICPNLAKKEIPNPRCYGHNFIDPRSKLGVMDRHGHGTHVSGIIAANSNNIGITGLSHQNVIIMPLKVNSDKVRGYFHNKRYLSDYYAMAIRFAIKNGAHVINISGGFPKHKISKQFKVAIDEAIAANIVVVAAAGNNNKDLPVFPCRYQSVICVGAIGNNGQMTRQTNFSQKVDILAPGEHIVSTYPLKGKSLEEKSRLLRIDGYEIKDGTSQAAPFVSGIIANLILENPGIKTDEVKARLFASAQPHKNINKDKFSSYGLVNMKDTLRKRSAIFFHPLLKDNDQILLNYPDPHFKYTIPVINHSTRPASVSIEVTPTQKVNFVNYKIKSPIIAAGESYNFNFEGEINSFDQDHLLNLHFKLISENTVRSYQANIIFITSLKSSKHSQIELKSNRIENKYFNFTKVENQKFAIIKPIQSSTHSPINPEFFATKLDKKNNKRIASVFRLNKSGYENLHYDLAPTDKVISIFKGDYNLDGKPDYLFYLERIIAKTKSSEQSQFYVFNFLDSKLAPLYGEKKSSWSININYPLVKLKILISKPGASTPKYKPLPLLDFSQNHPKFSWFRYKTELFGEILVPLVNLKGYSFQKGEINLIDTKRPTFKTQPFLLLPSLDEGVYSIKPAALYDNLIDETIRSQDQLDVAPWQAVTLGPSIPNKHNELLLSVGEGYNRSYHRLKLSSEAKIDSIKAIENKGLALLNNELLPVMSLTDNSISSQFLAHFSRWQTRSVFIDDEKIIIEKNAYSFNWSDPFFFLVDSFKRENDYQYYFASRHWIHYFSSNGETLRIPVKRESSLSRSQFSESIESVVIQTTNNITTGVSIDSSKLYGDLSFVAHESDGKFLRPIRFSLKLDRHCNYLPVIKFLDDKFSQQVFICNKNDKVLLNMVPIRY